MKRLIKKSNLDITNKNSFLALTAIFNYVYSSSNSRKKALDEFSSKINDVINSGLVETLPINMKVTRWYDFNDSQIEEVKRQIYQNGYYQYPFDVYSFSKLNAEDLSTVIKKDYGLFVEKDLSTINGYYVDVHNILTFFSDKDNFIKFLNSSLNDSNASQLLYFFYKNGIISDIPYDEWEINKININTEEIAYIDQQEIIIISDEIGRIYEHEIIEIK